MKTATKKLPELPELERVEVRNVLPVAIMGYILCLKAPLWLLIPWMYLKYRHYLQQEMGPVGSVLTAALVGVVFIVTILVLTKMFTTHFYWRADESGLVLRSIVGRRFIRWIELKDAFVKESTFGNSILRLQTADRTVSVPFSNGRLNLAALQASIRQHLMRYGKADHLPLSADAETLYYRIPEELPRELDWSGKAPWADLIGMPLMLLMFLSLWIYLAVTENGLMALYPGLLSLCFCFFAVVTVRGSLITVKQVYVNRDGVEAYTILGHVKMLWSEIISAHWEQVSGQRVLTVAGENQRVSVRMRPNDERAQMLILGLIRGLREAGNVTVAIPVDLCEVDSVSDLSSPNTATGAVVWRLSRAELRLIGALALVLSAIMFLLPILQPDVHSKEKIIPLLFFPIIGSVCWIAARSYCIIADDCGITKKCLFWSKQVKWQDISSVAIPKHSQSSARGHRLLKDLRGKTIMDLSFTWGLTEDRERFFRYMQTQLAHLLPEADRPKPWHARPRNSDG